MSDVESGLRRRVRRRADAVSGSVVRRDPLWPGQAAVAVAIALSATLPESLTIGSSWLVPAIEGAVFVGHVATTPRPPLRDRPRDRYLRVGLVGLVSGVSAVSLFLLAGALLNGGKTSGRDLLLAGSVLWIINVLLFAVWFWELDRGGPVQRLLPERDKRPDFLFPQMADAEWMRAQWEPAFDDYLYLSLHHAASFGPPDSPPLTRPSRLLMSLQTLASLATLVITVSYAVNNLS